MKIVVLDGYCLNPGDLSWDGFGELGEVEVYERTAAEEVAARARGARAVLTNKTPLTAETLAGLPELAYIGVLATGYNVVDVAAARGRGITVTNIPAYATASVAQFVFALLLELCRQVGRHAEAVRAGEWSRQEDWTFLKSPQVELEGKTMGLVGFGRIGRAVGRIADAMGMRVVACNRGRREAAEYEGFRWGTLEEVLGGSDVVSLHVPLLPGTQGMIRRETIRLMKRGAMLINTSRGGLVVDGDLAAALNAGELAGAAVDVLTVEPPAETNPLLGARNCLVTPHIAWATGEARARLMAEAVGNLAAFLRGAPVHVVE